MAAKVVIPEWVISCLEQYGNCACGRKLVEKYGEKKLLDHLDKIGLPCELEILSDNKEEEQYPKDGTYILTLKNLPSSSEEEPEAEPKKAVTKKAAKKEPAKKETAKKEPAKKAPAKKTAKKKAEKAE